MKKVIFVIILIFFFLQYSAIPAMGSSKIFVSEVLLATLIAIFLRRGYLENIFWAFLGGLLIDYFSKAPIGFHVIIFVCCAYAIDLIRRKVDLRNLNFSVVISVAFAVFIFSDLVAFLLYGILTWLKITSVQPIFLVSWEFFVAKGILALLSFGMFLFLGFVGNVFGENRLEIKIDKL